jgi:DivIVA domain-containing protein
VVIGEGDEPDQRSSNRSPGTTDPDAGPTDVRRAPTDIEGVSFPVSLRGYDRRAVDEYVARVSRLITELDASRSPESAVRHALEEVGEQTSSLLQRAGELAEEIAAGARRNADESTAHAKKEAEEIVGNARTERDEILSRAKAEAETMLTQSRKEAEERLQSAEQEVRALREEAEARMHELQADTEAIRQARTELLDDVRELAARVEEAATGADARFPPREPAGSLQEAMRETTEEAAIEQTDATAAAEPQDGASGGRARRGR